MNHKKTKHDTAPILPLPAQVATQLYAELEAGGLRWQSFRDLKGTPAIILVARGQFACDLVDTMMATIKEAMEQALKTAQAPTQPR